MKILLSTILFSTLSFGQQAARSSQSAAPPGPMVVEVEPAIHATSLAQLVRASDLIVQGVVAGALPTVNTSTDPNRASLETHSMVAVESVLVGSIPNDAATILLAQVGGVMERWNVSVAGDPVVSAGNRYILFLKRDERAALPNTSSMPRYACVGVWAGKVKVDGGTISFASAANARFHGYDNMSVSAFTKLVKDTANNAIVPTALLPIFPLPPRK